MEKSKIRQEDSSISLDGKILKVKEEENLVAVARRNKIFIPSLCYYEHFEVPLGTCRVCSCKVDGQIFPACMTKVKNGMEVEINTPELRDLRQSIVEMMFAEGNHFCPSCEKSGYCDLQHLGYEIGITHTRYPHLFKDRIIDFSPRKMILEHNRCVKCHRCVEEVFTADGERVFYFQNRGNETVLGIDYVAESKLSAEEAKRAMDICPTGAIILKGVSRTNPFGSRKFDLVSSIEERKREREKASKTSSRIVENKIIATTSLAGCFGCHMSLLDIDLGLLDILELVNFNKSPLTDIKNFSQMCDIGLIEGGCCNSENVEILREFRKKCKILVSVGECAIWGGVPAMRNIVPLEECLEEAYLDSLTSEPKEQKIPYHDDLPKLLDKVYPCHEIVEIDYHIPGCPPDASHIWKTVSNILWGEDYSILYSEFKYD